MYPDFAVTHSNGLDEGEDMVVCDRPIKNVVIKLIEQPVETMEPSYRPNHAKNYHAACMLR